MGVMSPQMLQGKRMARHLGNLKFKKLVRWFLIDEAHLTDEQSGPFQLPYQSIGNMRARLSSSTIWAAVTGTATPDRALVIAASLGFQPHHYINARYSVDRSNIKYIPRFLEHSVSGYDFLDLSFLIPFNMKSPLEIPSTLVFATTINTGHRIMQFLDRLIPSTIPNRFGIVKLYNALMPIDYREQFLRDLQEGSCLRIGIATDTCTLGLDVPNLRRTVAFDMCPSFENLKQKLGRPGRDEKPAEAIAFAPGWVRDLSIPDVEITGKQAVADLKRRKHLPDAMRSWYNPKPGHCSRAVDLQYNGERFVSRPNCCVTCEPQPEQSRDQATIKLWVEHFASVAAKNRPKALRSDGTYRPLDAPMKESLRHMLIRWRGEKWASIRGSDLGQSGLPPDVFMPQHIISQVVDRAHVCSELERLHSVCNGWDLDYLKQHGLELLQFLGKIMTVFSDIINERGEEREDEEGTEQHSDTEGACLGTPNWSPPHNLTRGRVVLRPKETSAPTLAKRPLKQSAPSDSSMPASKRRCRQSNKENEIV